MQAQIKTYLKEFDLRLTNCRGDILSLFMDKGFALSHSDIEDKINETYDRVTVYRTLKTFVDKGIIHKVLDDSGSAKYALCKDDCSAERHNHEHVHFKCLECGLTTCLDEVIVPQIQLPSGYEGLETNLLVQGICNSCSKINN